MAEKKRGKKRKDDYIPSGEEIDDKPTKEEFNVAKWMRNNVQIKKTKFANHNVEYFTGARAVDALLTAPFATRESPLFKTREEICDYLHIMLTHKFFHRARKVPIDEQELKGKRGKKKDKEKDKKNVESGEDEKKEKKEKEKDKGTDAESSVVEGSKDQKPEKEKRKKKIKLEMHFDQRFEDSLDAYVWIYDPIPFHYWIIGTLLVLGAIGVCLFPLWPPSVRHCFYASIVSTPLGYEWSNEYLTSTWRALLPDNSASEYLHISVSSFDAVNQLGVYYLSVAAAGFLVSIIVLAVIRLIVFCLIWVLTMGKHHLWILPNLTEDVGFFASFWPLYTYEYRGNQSKGDKKSKKKKKDKDSDAEDDDKKDDDHADDKEPLLNSGVVEVSQTDNVTEESQVDNVNGSESESESSQRSSTGKDFEMVDQDDVDS